MEGSKKFQNETGWDLSVLLSVRAGSTPGHIWKQVPFSLSRGTDQVIKYGNEDNPFLDGISLNAVASGEIVATQEFVFKRGSQIDDDFNTNDTVIFYREDEQILMRFENTWW